MLSILILIMTLAQCRPAGCSLPIPQAPPVPIPRRLAVPIPQASPVLIPQASPVLTPVPQPPMPVLQELWHPMPRLSHCPTGDGTGFQSTEGMIIPVYGYLSMSAHRAMVAEPTG